MTDRDRTASMIIRGDMPAGRVRIRTEPVLPVDASRRSTAAAPRARPVVFDIRDMSVYYGSNRALVGTSLKIYRNLVTAVIGPSGCGKSTFIRSLNRMNDSIPGFRLEGQVLYHGHDVYGSGANRVEVRRRIGMVFQKPNPFPKSIYDNVAWAAAEPRHEAAARRTGRARRCARPRCGRRSRTGCATARSACPAASSSGCASPGRSRSSRTCCCSTSRRRRSIRSSTAAIEDLMHNLKHRFTIVIVTHNMQQAARVADRTAFFSLDSTGAERVGHADRVRRHRDDLPRARPTRARATTSPGSFG